MRSDTCPRCGGHSLEHLSTHSHCWECGYSPEYDIGTQVWREIEFKKQTKKQRPQSTTTQAHDGITKRLVL